MSKGGSVLEDVGRLLAPQTTQGFLNAPLERQTRAQALDQGGALQDIVNAFTKGMQPAQTVNIGGQSEVVPPLKLSTQSMQGGAPVSGTPGLQSFIANDLPSLAFRADPQGTISRLTAPPEYKEVGGGLAMIPKSGGAPTWALDPLPKPREVGSTREYQKGGTKVTEQWDGKAWAPLGAGPAWKPDENKPQTAWRPMTEDEKRARSLDPATPFKIDDKTGNYEIVSTGSKFNNDQNKAAGFANTMQDAADRIDAIPAFDPTSGVEAARGMTNVTASPKYQQYKQAALDWTLAVLRQESGANVPDTEAAKYWTTFFPQYGDSKEVITQKAASRASKMKGVTAAAGGAYEALRNKPNAQPGQQQQAPQAIPAPAERKAGQAYDTPKGKMTWTGTGWVPAQ